MSDHQIEKQGLKKMAKAIKNEQLMSFLRDNYNPESYQELLIEQYNEAFSSKELSELNQFFSSELGQKYIHVSRLIGQKNEAVMREDFEELQPELF